MLHVGAADYCATLYINGQMAGEHKGGYVSFSFDISRFVHAGENVVTIYVTDDERDRLIPRGKQSELFRSHELRLHPHHRHLADGMAGVHAPGRIY